MAKTLLCAQPVDPGKATCTRAYRILALTHSTVASLLNAFDNPGGTPRKAGSPTESECDLLRAMLVFAGAGLDAVLKELVKTALGQLADSDDAVGKKLRESVRAAMQRADGSNGGAGSDFLARAALARDSRTFCVDHVAGELTSGSLQSAEELKRVLPFLGMQPSQVQHFDNKVLKAAFDVRNLIIHEMDMRRDCTGKPLQRTRNTRKRADMVRHANAVLQLADEVLASVAARL